MSEFAKTPKKLGESCCLELPEICESPVIAGDERELLHVAMKVCERKLHRGIFFEIVQSDPGEVANDDVSWDIVVTSGILETVDILDRLAFRLFERLAPTLVLDDQRRRPETGR